MTEYGILVWVNEKNVDAFITDIQSDSRVSEYEFTEQTEVDDD